MKQLRDDITPAEYLAELRSGALLAHESLQGIDLALSPTNHALHVGRTFALSYNALQAQLEARAQWATDGEEEGSPYLALATHLRALAARLPKSPDQRS